MRVVLEILISLDVAVCFFQKKSLRSEGGKLAEFSEVTYIIVPEIQSILGCHCEVGGRSFLSLFIWVGVPFTMKT